VADGVGEIAENDLSRTTHTGLSVEEAAQALSTSRASAYRRWTYARAWLHARLGAGSGPS
jgi:hypothetical protein